MGKIDKIKSDFMNILETIKQIYKFLSVFFNVNVPIVTRSMFSRFRKSRTAVILPSCWIWIRAFLVIPGIFLSARTSTSLASLIPSLKSNCRFSTTINGSFVAFSFSLTHLVKVFCWIFFQGASSDNSRSA